MPTDDSLKVAPVARKHAEYAVLNWHYSQAMPSGKLITYGVWEHGRYIGAVIYGRGASPWPLIPYGLKQSEGCELVRVALTQHDAPVTRIVAESLRLLRASNPGLRLVLSYADPVQGHHGGIYQAGNWVYIGPSAPNIVAVIHGREMHSRSYGALPLKVRPGESRLECVRRTIDPKARVVQVPPKHRYAMPLDKQMRRRMEKLAQPYPERAAS